MQGNEWYVWWRSTEKKKVAYAKSYNILFSKILPLTTREYRITNNSIDCHIITLNYSLFFSPNKKNRIILSIYLIVAYTSKPCPLNLKKSEKIICVCLKKIFIYLINNKYCISYLCIYSFSVETLGKQTFVKIFLHGLNMWSATEFGTDINRNWIWKCSKHWCSSTMLIFFICIFPMTMQDSDNDLELSLLNAYLSPYKFTPQWSFTLCLKLMNSFILSLE